MTDILALGCLALMAGISLATSIWALACRHYMSLAPRDSPYFKSD